MWSVHNITVLLLENLIVSNQSVNILRLFHPEKAIAKIGIGSSLKNHDTSSRGDPVFANFLIKALKSDQPLPRVIPKG